MARGVNSGDRYCYGEVSDEDRRALLNALGAVAGGTVAGTTLRDLRAQVSIESGSELAEMGRTIRAGLTGSIDAALLSEKADALVDSFDRLSRPEAAGVPEAGARTYGELTDPAWAINDHLAEAGFFESAERNLPAFDPAHIETTARGLLQLESLPATLSEVGFSPEERTALVANVVTARERLSWWMPAEAYPPADVVDDGVVREHVAPLHQRAAEGSLLWIDGLDHFFWTNEVLLTPEMLDRGRWDVKSMLGGYYLLGAAARDLARGDVADEHLATLISGSTAIMIVAQEFLQRDVIRITDEKRAPREDRPP